MKKNPAENNSNPPPDHLQTSYFQAIQYLYDRLPVFHHVGKSAYKPGLENTIRLLNFFNNPQNAYKTIHVAGTNGKGSVSHMLASVLQQAGYKVGLYTSPHLVDFGERIRVNGEKIAPDYVVNFVKKSEKLFDEIQPSFFEATMTMAFHYFMSEKVDLAVIETGLGGRLDSTNIISPELSVITNISFDHTAFLGDTLEKIAAEKAGIIKQNIPVVIGESLPETRPVFLQKANEMNAPLIFAEEKLQIISSGYENGKLKVRTSENKTYFAGLTGIYQNKNMLTALAAISRLKEKGFRVTDENIQSGLKDVAEKTGLQGRWQTIRENPKITLDTAHNVAGIEQIVSQLKEQKYKTLRIVIGMVNDKDISAVLTLLPRNAVYYFTQANIERALNSENLRRQASQTGLNGKAYSSVAQAVQSAIGESDAEDFIFIGGSNFVVGEALEYLRRF